ncbi:hypothetical protein BCR36DRAFT_6913 [Piromyces finnis]|uniref:Uncharacterized protein n=1 Tax=Piromyces finnis TaxID=1754191 RepID=A0A1Y1VPN8_9FUNG|nr:hypothetical protein BCR36DRAFT_6913 [Piromyces finnis]|eukprot:ORX61102.1 hypothetical protein BCR36DRAFT_6913 [Piromyces finnis]
MNEDEKRTNKIRLNELERRLLPFFNSLPQDVPVGWMIPYLFFIEDFQFLQYVQSYYVYLKQRPFITKLFTAFNSNVTGSLHFYFFYILYTFSLLYIYFILFYYLKTNGRKSVSKKTLRFTNTVYQIIFKYLLTFVLGFYTRTLFVCSTLDGSMGIPKCGSFLSNLYLGINIACMLLIFVYSIMYSNFNFNTNCLSNGKYFGSIHKANCNKLLLVKFILPFLVNVATTYMIQHRTSPKIIMVIVGFGIMFTFSYLAITQLLSQSYYSRPINNYRFSVYFTMATYSAFGNLSDFLGINSSQLVCDIAPVLLVILFITGYFINNYYHKKSLERIYKNLCKKKITDDLRNNMTNDQLYQIEKKKKNIYNSVDRITKEVFVKKEIKVFRNLYECEFACRFIRDNRSIEAYNMMKMIFEEGILQYKHEADIYITAWYYMHSMKIFYKENNLLHKYGMYLFNADHILNSVMDLKLDLRKKFLVSKAQSYIDIEKRENSMNISSTDVEESIKLEKLKVSVITSHIHSLMEIKTLFSKLSNSTNVKDIATYFDNISQISRLQKSTNFHYSYIIREHPEAKDIKKMYILFLMDVMNKEEMAYKLANGNAKLLEASPKGGMATNDSSKLDKKALTASSNSLGSNLHSEDTSTGLGKEIRKKINNKNMMIKKLVQPLNSCKMRMLIFIGVFIMLFIAKSLYTMFVLKNIQDKTTILARNINIPGAMKTTTFSIRMLSYNLMTGNGRTIGKNIGAIRGTMNYLTTVNMESVNNIMDISTGGNSLIVPVGEYAFDTYEEKTLADSYKNFITNMKYCVNRGMLSPNETVENILYEPHFKYFIANSKSKFDLVFNKCKEVCNDLILSQISSLEVVTVSLEIALIGVLAIIAYIVFIPLNKLSNKISTNSLRMFRFFSKENFKEIIYEYKDKIESLCESYDIDEENVEKKKTYNKNIKLFVAFALIFIYMIIDTIPTIDVINDVTSTLKIVQKSADRLSLLKGIQLYTYEVINQDRSIFLEDEPERILKDMIQSLEVLY